MFDNQASERAATTIATGQTTGSLAIGTGTAAKLTRVWIDFIALGAGGYVVAEDGSVQSCKFYFPVAGTLYVGLWFEVPAAGTLSLAATLDYAAAVAVPLEAMVRTEVT